MDIFLRQLLIIVLGISSALLLDAAQPVIKKSSSDLSPQERLAILEKLAVESDDEEVVHPEGPAKWQEPKTDPTITKEQRRRATNQRKEFEEQQFLHYFQEIVSVLVQQVVDGEITQQEAEKTMYDLGVELAKYNKKTKNKSKKEKQSKKTGRTSPSEARDVETKIASGG